MRDWIRASRHRPVPDSTRWSSSRSSSSPSGRCTRRCIFSDTLITGGDTGSHLAVPAYLKSVGNPFNLTPWYPGWFAGMPAYTYYFVLPDVLAWFGSYIIGFAVAFKLATILGSVLMPITAYMLGRLFKAPRPIPGGAGRRDAALPLRRLVHHRRRQPLLVDGGGVRVRALARAEPLDHRTVRARGTHRTRLLAGRHLAQCDVGRAHLAVVLDHRSGDRRRDLRAVAAPRHRRPQRRATCTRRLRASAAIRGRRRADLGGALGVVADVLRHHAEVHELHGLHQRPREHPARHLHATRLVHLDGRRGRRPLGHRPRGHRSHRRLLGQRPPGHDPDDADGALASAPTSSTRRTSSGTNVSCRSGSSRST